MLRRATRTFAWATVSYGANKVIVFISTVVLARLLAPEEFGVVAAGMALILYFEVALDLGLGAALVYEQEEGITDRVRTAFTLNLAMALLLTAIGVAAAPAVAGFFHLQHQVLLFRALFLYLPIHGVGQVQNAVLQRDLAFGKRAGAVVTSGVVRAAISVALAVLGAGAWSLVAGLLAGEMVGSGLLWYHARVTPKLRLDRAVARALLGFGTVYTLLQIVNAIGTDGDYVVVGHIRGATALGYYSVGYRLPELMLTGFFWMFSSVAFPVYAQTQSTDPGKTILVMLRAMRMITVFSFPASVILALAARDVIGVLFSAKWAPAVGPMMLIALASGLVSPAYASGDVFSARGRPGTLLALNIPLTTMLVIGFIFAAHYSITAVAAVHLILSAVYTTARLELVNRVLKASWGDMLRSMGPAAAATLGAALLAAPLRLLIAPGPVALAAIVTAGLIGAAAGILLTSRDTVGELGDIVASFR